VLSRLEALAHRWLMLCVFSFVAQAPGQHGFSLDLLSLLQDLVTPAVIDVGRRQVPKALMIPLGVIVFDERPDLPFEIPGQQVMLE